MRDPTATTDAAARPADEGTNGNANGNAKEKAKAKAGVRVLALLAPLLLLASLYNQVFSAEAVLGAGNGPPSLATRARPPPAPPSISSTSSKLHAAAWGAGADGDERMADGSLSVEAACARLRQDPKPLGGVECLQRNASSNLCTRGGDAHMMGQYWQDYYLYAGHFRNLSRVGTYVDVAAHDPVVISNTWFFDACLGWRGVCVDANPMYAGMLRDGRRTCHVCDTCVGARRGEKVRFVLANGLGGIVGTNKNMLKLAPTGPMAFLNQGEIELVCSTLAEQLRHRALHVVDYLSLDVEGHELAVLHGVDWHAVRINVITVESNDPAVDAFLRAKGYLKRPVKRGRRTDGVLTMLQDDLYVRRDVQWGNPL